MDKFVLKETEKKKKDPQTLSSSHNSKTLERHNYRCSKLFKFLHNPVCFLLNQSIFLHDIHNQHIFPHDMKIPT